MGGRSLTLQLTNGQARVFEKTQLANEGGRADPRVETRSPGA